MTYAEPKRGPGRPRTKNPIQAPNPTPMRAPAAQEAREHPDAVR